MGRDYTRWKSVAESGRFAALVSRSTGSGGLSD
jgi:hypothetical protein